MISIKSPFPYRPAANDTLALRLRRQALFLISVTGFLFCLTILYHGQRVVMRMGGFVARGGPYVIAHPAPGWVWMMPVSILSGLVFFFLCLALAERVPEPKLLPSLAWPGLFLPLGWNFFEFGLRPPGQQGLVWGWLICGIAFFLMGFFPLLWIVQGFRQTLRKRSRESPATATTAGRRATGFLLLQLGAIYFGFYLGRTFFMSQAYPPRPQAAQQKVEEKPVLARLAQVELEFGGRKIILAGSVDGRWRLVYEGQVFSRMSDLPGAVRRDLEKALAGLREVLK